MFWTTWNCTSTLFSDLLLDFLGCTTGVDVDWLWWLGDVSVHVAALLNQLSLAPIPLGEDFGRRSTAENTRVNETCETNMWDVTR